MYIRTIFVSSTWLLCVRNVHSFVFTNFGIVRPLSYRNSCWRSRSNKNFKQDVIIQGLFAEYGDASSSGEEPLSAIFRRAVVLQRSGDHVSALTEYQTFIKVAEQFKISPEMYAEVHVNMGGIFLKIKQYEEARKHFQIALDNREIGSAYVNLALLTLKQGQQSTQPEKAVQALKEAKVYCTKAINLNDESDGFKTATKMLIDIDSMLSQAQSNDNVFQ